MAANPIDLTTVAAVEAALAVPQGGNDTLIQSLITSASQLICNWCGRSTFVLGPVTDFYDGQGGQVLMLRQWPVQSITSLSIDGVPIPAASVVSGQLPTNGYFLEPVTAGVGPQRIIVYGYQFNRGRGNIIINYQAGYSTIPPVLAQAALELVGEAFARRTRLGTVSKTLGGQETMHFSQKDMNATIATMLAPYRRVVPAF